MTSCGAVPVMTSATARPNEFGTGGTLAQPKRAATRGEVVYILHRIASVEAAWDAYGGTPPGTVVF